ncbi:carboxy-terminal domain RNA polymerase II polypeptide A small phosphatase 1 [Pelomyxa schiedti]|nr:carboxy-terminal domain RNA polymerase II polypeptide A small phosphatase 1 [Pelomyxa schiedti]
MTAPLRYLYNLVAVRSDDKSKTAAASVSASKRTGLLKPQSRKRKTLVLDLDETLIRTSYEPIPNPDFVVKVEGQRAYVKKRPGVDRFLNTLKDKYELVLFTASAREYAEPVLNFLDVNRVFSARLYRDSCSLVGGMFVKDLSRLGRDLNQVILVDNSPVSYSLQPQNGLPISSFVGDSEDNELFTLLPFLNTAANSPIPVPVLLHGFLNKRVVCIKTREN